MTAETWKPEELIDWLKGYTLPALGYEDEPYDWILRAFPQDDSAARYKSIFAYRIAEFLRSEEFYRQIPEDDRLLFNLFYLCANLNRKEELAQPLEEVFDFFQFHERERETFFSERKMFNLNAAFREALISNQTSTKYLPFWKTILEQQQPLILRGNIFSGFLGVLYASKNGAPLVEEIAWALGKMANYFVQTNDKKRPVKFRNLITRVKEVWDSYDWDEILFFHTVRRPWQHWATVRLPRMVMPLGHSPSGFSFLIWNIYVPFLKVLEINYRELSREDIFAKIEVPASFAETLVAKLAETERERLRAPFYDYKGVAKAVCEHLYMDLSDDDEDYAGNEPLTDIRIKTYEPATSNPAEGKEKQIEAQNALTETFATAQAG